MTDPARQVLIAGTAGGVGTTTVAALLFSTWPGRFGAPRLADHTGGTLGLRLAEGDGVGRLDDETVLVDAGASAFALASELTGSEHRLVLVTGGTPLGCALADRCLDRLRFAGGPEVLSRTTLALVHAFGQHRLGARVTELGSHWPQLAGVVSVPADSALAAGGRIPSSRLGRPARRAIAELADLAEGGRPVAGVRVSG